MKKIIQIILLFVFVNTAIAQTGNVGIGTPSPDPSSILDVTSTTKGFLFPRMSTTDRDAITTPAFGLTIFNTTINCLEMNLGSGTANWVTAVCPCLSAPAQPASFSGTGTGSNLCLSTNYVYTVPTVAGVQYYLWTITNGTIVSGQGTTSVTVSFSSNAATLNVVAGNTCGTSSPKAATINFKAAPSTPTINGFAIVGANQSSVTYTIASPVVGETYNWSLPTPGKASFVGGVNTGSSISLTFSGGTIGTGVATTLSVTASNCGGTASQTKGITAGGTQTYNTPTTSTSWGNSTYGVTSLTVDMAGASGGTASAGSGVVGYGARLTCSYSISASTVLNIYVGGKGGNGSTGNSTTAPAGGINGGGTGNKNNDYYGGGGGGASDIRIGGTALANRVLVAGGGGGASYDYYCPGGTESKNGGNAGAVGAAGAGCATTNPGGGTTSAGGVAGSTNGGTAGTAGSLGVGGNAGWSIYTPSIPDTYSGGAGGGGGYYGGGGGAASGGGGGSSFPAANGGSVSSLSVTTLGAAGDGYIILKW